MHRGRHPRCSECGGVPRLYPALPRYPGWLRFEVFCTRCWSHGGYVVGFLRGKQQRPTCARKAAKWTAREWAWRVWDHNNQRPT